MLAVACHAVAVEMTDSTVVDSAVTNIAMTDSVVTDTTANRSAAVDSTKIGAEPATKVVKDDGASQFNNFDAIKYILDSRYRNMGDDFSKRWDDHLFLEVGVGMERMLPPASDYEFAAMTTAHLGVGKQFNRNHSARFIFNGAYTNMLEKDVLFYRLGAKIDHLFSLSSYMSGYNPARLLDVSTVLGVGYNYSKLSRYGKKGGAMEAHAGLQLRFFTGPQGYLNLEPYIGVAQDGYDLSERENWRKYDVFYGANVNFVYYLNNNLSRRARKRYINRIKDRSIFENMPDSVKKTFVFSDTTQLLYSYKNDAIINDTTLYSWQTPWFVEASTGPSWMDSPRLGMTETMGYNFSVAGGKWFSPLLGVRLAASVSSVKWREGKIPYSPSPLRPEYKFSYNTIMYGGSIEAMLNPMGLFKRFSWDDPFGANIFVGAGLGWVIKDDNEKLSCRVLTYTAGLQAWAKVSDGLRLFVEPRFTHSTYRIPYNNVDWDVEFADNYLHLNVGLSMLLRDSKFVKTPSESMSDGLRRFEVGLGGGMPLIAGKKSYEGDNAMKWNASAYGLFRFNGISGVRLGFEFMQLSTNSMESYTDYNLDYPNNDYIPVDKEGLWNRKYNIGLFSASYVLDLKNVIYGANNWSRFGVDFFVGPSLSVIFANNNELFSGERHQENHVYVINKEKETKMGFGVHAGVNLKFSITKRLGVFASPTIYCFKDLGLPEQMKRKVMVFETLNFGVNYKF